MIFNKIILKIILLILFTLVCLSSCRYKDNDRLVIATVKQRIEKTWYLKEYTLNGIVSNVNYSSTLKIKIPSKKFINIERDNAGIYTQFLFNSKTVIKYKDDTDSRELKITKLTKDQLWLIGYPIFTGASDPNDKVIYKYSSKP